MLPTLALCLAAVADTAPAAPAPDSARTVAATVTPLAVAPAPALSLPRVRADTGAKPRPKAVEYSDAYATRLTIHRWASYAMLPVFVGQYAAGRQLVEKGRYDAPQWARTSHAVLATTTAGLFGLNTLTGVWNLWEGRHDPSGRAWRTTHSVLMLVADAGFVATGLAANDAGESRENRQRHQNLAIGSMAVATTSWLMMLPFVRGDH